MIVKHKPTKFSIHLHGLGVGKYPGHRHHPLPRHPLQRPDDAAQQHVGETGSDGKFDCVHGTVANGGEEKSKTHSRQALGGKYVRVRQLTVVGKYFIRGTGTYPGTK